MSKSCSLILLFDLKLLLGVYESRHRGGLMRSLSHFGGVWMELKEKTATESSYLQWRAKTSMVQPVLIFFLPFLCDYQQTMDSIPLFFLSFSFCPLH